MRGVWLDGCPFKTVLYRIYVSVLCTAVDRNQYFQLHGFCACRSSNSGMQEADENTTVGYQSVVSHLDRVNSIVNSA